MKRLSILFAVFLIAFAVASPGLVAFGTAGNTQSSCRVTPRPTSFSETRTLQPYTGTDPLTHISIDVCVASFLDAYAENRTPAPFGDGLSITFSDAHTLLQGSYDPSFSTLLFSVTLDHSTVGFTHDSYDGVTDFGGTSGSMHTNFKQALVTINADVKDPSFFEQPHQIYLRASTPNGVTIQGSGMYTAVADVRASIGVVERFNL